MIRKNLAKGLILGLCFAALSTGTAYAQSMDSMTPAFVGEAQSDELKELYAKQSEIDRSLFTDHAKGIEEKGFMINYTAVSGDVIEIGISPYSEENANYLYELLGDTDVKVVEFDQSIIYASTVVDESVSADGGSDVTAPDAQETPEDEGEYSIQIESISEDAVEDSVADDAVLYNKSGEVAGDMSKEQWDAAMKNNEFADNVEKETKEVPFPMIILTIAGGAALIGGAVLVLIKAKK